jgi:hypothetical protein
MTVNYTTNLSLGLPVTGTESGTWGDDVNNATTAYLDIAIAGGLSIAITTADVTLTNTQGTNSATNIGSTTGQYAILNLSGAMTAARSLILPSSSKWYIINNNCTGNYLLTVKGAATSGVTMINGEKSILFWSGTDYVKATTSGGATGGGSDQIFIQNGQTVTVNYTISTNYNAGTFGPISINSGVTVTVPTGSVWSII